MFGRSTVLLQRTRPLTHRYVLARWSQTAASKGDPQPEKESGVGSTTIGASTHDTLFTSGEINSPASEAKGQTPSTGGVGSPYGTAATHWTLNNVRRDHDLVRQNLERLCNLEDKDEKQRLFNDTVKMLAQHDVAEEVVCCHLSFNLRNLRSSILQLRD